MKIEHKFDIGDQVYHITPESPVGIVTDWYYCRRENSVSYLVSFGIGESLTYYEDELTTSKHFPSYGTN